MNEEPKTTEVAAFALAVAAEMRAEGYVNIDFDGQAMSYAHTVPHTYVDIDTITREVWAFRSDEWGRADLRSARGLSVAEAVEHALYALELWHPDGIVSP